MVDSISSLSTNIGHVDPSFNGRQKYNIYTCVIVNDTSLQMPLIANVFNKRFGELLKNIHVEKLNIKPLTVIHVSDLERLEDYLNAKPNQFWELLNRNFSDRKFIPPFYTTREYYVLRIPEPRWIRNLINKTAEIIGVQ